jgi:hypothetical protein
MQYNFSHWNVPLPRRLLSTGSGWVRSRTGAMVPAGAACGAAGKLESCVVEHPEPRSPLGVGLEVASRITTIGMEFALPAAAGFGLDSWMGTTPAATLTGAVLGFLAGMYSCVRMARDLSAEPRGPGKRPDDGPGRGDRLDKPT